MRISTTLATREQGFTDEALEGVASDLLIKGETTLTDPEGNKFPARVIEAAVVDGKVEVTFDFDPTKGLEADIKGGTVDRLDDGAFQRMERCGQHEGHQNERCQLRQGHECCHQSKSAKWHQYDAKGVRTCCVREP